MKGQAVAAAARLGALPRSRAFGVRRCPRLLAKAIITFVSHQELGRGPRGSRRLCGARSTRTPCSKRAAVPCQGRGRAAPQPQRLARPAPTPGRGGRRRRTVRLHCAGAGRTWLEVVPVSKSAVLCRAGARGCCVCAHARARAPGDTGPAATSVPAARPAWGSSFRPARCLARRYLAIQDKACRGRCGAASLSARAPGRGSGDTQAPAFLRVPPTLRFRCDAASWPGSGSSGGVEHSSDWATPSRCVAFDADGAREPSLLLGGLGARS